MIKDFTAWYLSSMVLCFGAFCLGYGRFPNTLKLWIISTILWPIAATIGLVNLIKIMIRYVKL
jgi:hypothetical protein